MIDTPKLSKYVCVITFPDTANIYIFLLELKTTPERYELCFYLYTNSKKIFFFLESKHVKQGSVMGFLSGMFKIMKAQEWRGDMKQQGGTFILGPGKY